MVGFGESPCGGDQVGFQLRDLSGVGGSVGLGFGEIVADAGSEWFEPCRDLTPRLQRRLVAVWGSVGVGQLAALCGGGDVGAVAGQDAFEDVACLVEVAAVGDDQDQVLLFAAGDGDVQASTGGRCGGEFDTDGHGVGLVAMLGGRVPEADMLADVVDRQGHGAAAEM